MLVDANGVSIMTGQHPLGDLAPRDVVARAIHQRIGDGGGAFLDARAAIGERFPEEFPAVFAACMAGGIDPRREPIPVAPAAHYHMGGVMTDEHGRTSLEGLFAAGECASTGVHGANRLASNSLTESLIAGRRVGNLLGRDLPRPAASLRLPPAGPGMSPAGRAALAAAMSRHAGVLRDRAGLELLLGMLEQASAGGDGLDLAGVEATSLHTVSTLVAAAALARVESRGCHRWRNVPAASDARARHTVLHVLEGRLRMAGAVRSGIRASA